MTSPLCSICELDSNTIIVGTLLVAWTQGMTKEKRFPTSEKGRWVSFDGKLYEILRYCDKCRAKYAINKDIYKRENGKVD